MKTFIYLAFAVLSYQAAGQSSPKKQQKPLPIDTMDTLAFILVYTPLLLIQRFNGLLCFKTMLWSCMGFAKAII